MDTSDRDLFLISLFTFFTVVSWVFFELAKTYKTTTTPTTVEKIITPFTPKLDTDILTILENRKRY